MWKIKRQERIVMAKKKEAIKSDIDDLSKDNIYTAEHILSKKKNTEIVETGSESPAIIVHHKEEVTIPKWLPLFRTQIEDLNGEQYLAEVQQNNETKDIRTVKVL
jgi:hypothetical protein